MKQLVVAVVATVVAPALVQAADLIVRTRISTGGSMADLVRARVQPAPNIGEGLPFWAKWAMGKQLEQAQQAAAEGSERALRSLEPREQVRYMSARRSVLDSGERR